jgi:hypothetical protein
VVIQKRRFANVDTHVRVYAMLLSLQMNNLELGEYRDQICLGKRRLEARRLSPGLQRIS